MQIKAITFDVPLFSAEFGKATKKAQSYKNGDKREPFWIELDMASLPPESLTYALNYGVMQYLADGAAGAEDAAGYRLGIEQRIEKLRNADFSRAKGEAKPDTETQRARKLAAQALRDKVKAAGAKADTAKINEAAAKIVESQPRWIELARKQLAEEAKARENTEIDFDLGDLIAESEGEGEDEEA